MCSNRLEVPVSAPTAWRARAAPVLNGSGSIEAAFFMTASMPMAGAWAQSADRCVEKAPTEGEIDISLSLRMTNIRLPSAPALFIAS